MPEKNPPSKIFFPTEYLGVLENNIVIVTGVGKSGTTIAALLMCSCSPTYHIYEPVLLKAIPPDLDIGINFVTRVALLYDYIIPIARGMRICDYEFQTVNSEWQWATCQRTRSERRGDPQFDGSNIQPHLFHENPLFVINILNGLSRIDQWKQVFPGMHVVHIVRNGFDVIASEMRRNWHEHDYYLYALTWSADWLFAEEKWPMPIYVEDEARECWLKWTPITRAAHIWRTQVNMHPPDIRFEELTSEPLSVLHYYASRFKRLKKTELTEPWLRRLVLKKIPPHELTIKDIQEPERKKFKETMEKLEYL